MNKPILSAFIGGVGTISLVIQPITSMNNKTDDSVYYIHHELSNNNPQLKKEIHIGYTLSLEAYTNVSEQLPNSVISLNHRSTETIIEDSIKVEVIMENSFVLNDISNERISLSFINPFIVDYEFVKDVAYFSYDNDELRIYAYGRTLEELKENIIDNLLIDWQELVQCDDERLTESALESKNMLMSVLRENK